MSKLLKQAQELTPNVSFVTGEAFYWAPGKSQIQYHPIEIESKQGAWALLHEVAHAQLEHTSYKSDFELLKLEVAAWDRAKELGDDLGFVIDEEHIQDCLDTYRDWLHRRSTCPTCGNVGLQHNSSEYKCHNCNTTWHVTAARFCRPYRRKLLQQKEKSSGSLKNQTTFR